MKSSFFPSLILALLGATSSFAQTEGNARHINWSQPDVGCVEDLYPQLPTDEKCARANLTDDEQGDCELKKKVALVIAHPETRLPFLDWMDVQTHLDVEKKIEVIYSAAKKYDLPPQFLYGVVNLEGSISDLGIIRDGNNYSCGTGSVNIGQWCTWMKSLSPDEQTKAGWPVGIDCTEATLPAKIVSAIFSEADFSKSISYAEKGHEEMEEQLLPELAVTVSDENILRHLHGLNKTKKLQAIRSFTNHCSEIEYSIPVIAYSLVDLFNRYIPAPLKNTQIYKDNQTFKKVCRYPYASKYYPLQPGLLLAYGIHNEGEDLGEALSGRLFQKRLSTMVDFSAIDFPELFQLKAHFTGHQFGDHAMINIPLVIKRMRADGAPQLLPADETSADGS